MVTFMIPLGFSVASGILIGRSIGEGSKLAIEQYFKLCMVASVFVAIFQNIALVLFMDGIIAVFTNIEAISVHIRFAWAIFNLFVFFDTT